jgi:hypothetical protein
MEGSGMTDRELDQLKLVSEYVKFHIGLYLATPPVLAILAEGFKVTRSPWCYGGIAIMVVIYLISGVSAGLFMSNFINVRWDNDHLKTVGA